MAGLVGTWHNEEEGCIQLAPVPPVFSSLYTTGTVESTLRTTSNEVIKACLQVEEDKPAGTNIQYEISTQSGAEGHGRI